MDQIKTESALPPLVSIVGKSGSGKTTLVEKIIHELTKKGLRVGSIKHHYHQGNLEIDHPGKDSWRHKQAGAERVVISSPNKIGIIMDVEHDHALDELIPYFSGMDIVLSEGFKREDKPKVEIFRSGVHKEPLCLDDDDLIAIITDMEDLDLKAPRFALDDIAGLMDLIVKHFNLPARGE
ncbi:molybdopterin-guanine dinucleotide biosynthesis protein B [Thermodesulfobacteriota bacterium]